MLSDPSTLFKTTFFVFALLGWFYVLRKKCLLEYAFIPIAVCSGVICLVFIGGLLNLMFLTCCCIVAVGFMMFVRALAIDGRYLFDEVTKFLKEGGIWYIIAIAFFASLHNGMRLLAYDDFSHWGAIVRELLNTGMLPRWSSKMILFRSYPPGSALFIYFMSVMTGLGKSEGFWLFAQSVLYTSCFFTFFCLFSGRRSLVLQCVTPVLLFYFLSWRGFPYDLYVDSLLYAYGFSSTAILLHSRDKGVSPPLLLISLIMVAIVLIKNSGIFFVAANLVWYLLFFKTVQIKKTLLLLGGMPFLALLLWNAHLNLVFSPEQLAQSKHAMTIENYVKGYKAKSSEDIRNILRKFVASATELEKYNMILCVLVIVLCAKGRSSSPFLLLVAGGAFMYLLYMTGMLLMYIFSMPTGEALRLAGFYRYRNTVLFYLICVGLYSLMVELSRTPLPTLRRRFAWYVLTAGLLLYSINPTTLIRPQYVGSVREGLEKSLGSFRPGPQERVLVLFDQDYRDSGYRNHLLRFLLWSNNFSRTTSESDGAELVKKIATFSHVLSVDGAPIPGGLEDFLVPYKGSTSVFVVKKDK